jgi:apolipoprotein N-acyltransferase
MITNKKTHPVFLSIAAGIILWLSWPTSPLTLFIFFGFVPLFRLADSVNSRSKFFKLTYLAMFLWNLLTTWWIINASLVGACLAIIANSFLMCLPWWGYHIFKQKFNRTNAYFAFVCFWMFFEYNHLNWQLSWPWLNLGNVFATQTFFIQWYEYTGVGGGTLLVLIWNILFYDKIFLAKAERTKRRTYFNIAFVTVVFLIQAFAAFLFGFLLNFGDRYAPNEHSNIIIVQPNIDPYGKFQEGSVTQQIQKHLQLSESQIDSATRLVIWPETALSAGNVPIDQVQNSAVYQPVFDFVNRHPNITLLTGIETLKWYGQEKPLSPYAHKTAEGYYYDSYNAAVTIKAGQPLQFYIKSKLVPGVETLPTYLNFLGSVFEKFGGTTGGYAKDTASMAFRNVGNPFTTAPIICYESIYGEYVASYVAKGADLLTIMTNDGWWGNTPGHKQHLNYARLRAIETRTWVARSANTGISAVINEYGEILQTQQWDTAAVIKYSLPYSKSTHPKRKTFYVKHGDYLYLIFSLLAGLLVLWNVILWLRRKFRF